MTSDASSFLAKLGADDEDDDVPRRRKPAPAPAVRRRPTPEPVRKTSVDLYLSLRQGLDELCDRDHRGPKAELNDALRAHLEAKGITITPWKG